MSVGGQRRDGPFHEIHKRFIHDQRCVQIGNFRQDARGIGRVAQHDEVFGADIEFAEIPAETILNTGGDGHEGMPPGAGCILVLGKCRCQHDDAAGVRAAINNSIASHAPLVTRIVWGVNTMTLGQSLTQRGRFRLRIRKHMFGRDCQSQ